MKLGILLLAAALTGCTISSVPAGPTQYDTKVIDRDASKSAQVRLHMGAGDLKISSGTQKLLRATEFGSRNPRCHMQAAIHWSRKNPQAIVGAASGTADKAGREGVLRTQRGRKCHGFRRGLHHHPR